MPSDCAHPSVVVQTRNSRYDVIVGSSLLEGAGTLFAGHVEGPACAVISDDNVAALYAPAVITSLISTGFQPVLIAVPPGEKSKSLGQVEAICDRMAREGLDRSSFVVALGGGMVGDLGGFVAATYHRGIPHVQLPTTLLAQADSSIGGKTAVNIAAAKNLLGAFHQPALVVADVDTLASLPEREWKQGFAEIIKHAIIRDAAMFEMLERFDRKDLAALVHRNAGIKAAIVSADEREITGERMLLNFGHTVGHAIERAGDYGTFLHGEAVSLGVVAAASISRRKFGLSASDEGRILDALRAFELPTRLPADFPREKILEAIRFDKKFARGEVRFVVTRALGSAEIATDVTMADIEGAVNSLYRALR